MEEYIMKKPVLVIMAAGMGSRYGGLKQIDPIDDQGHIIMDFSIFDAKRAGFEKVVFIIKKENEKDFKEVIGNRMADVMDVEYVFQDLTNLPEGFEVPDGRIKPWGTAHAVLSCIDRFVKINADSLKSVEIYNGFALGGAQHDDLVAIGDLAGVLEDLVGENHEVQIGRASCRERV